MVADQATIDPMKTVFVRRRAGPGQDGFETLCYHIVERESGRLAWLLLHFGPAHPDRRQHRFRLEHDLGVNGSLVTESEAESITGLLPPACWDRLREMM